MRIWTLLLGVALGLFQRDVRADRPDHSPLDWSLGILTLVRDSSPDVPIYSWDSGTSECGQAAATVTLHCKNIGPEAIWLSCATVPTGTGFSGATDCPCSNVLAPGQMASCVVSINFSPSADGVYRDTMSIETDASNGYGGYLRVPLVGLRTTTLASPQVVATIQGNNAVLNWNPVSQSVLGCPFTATGYSVYYSLSPGGPSFSVTATSDTSTTITNALQLRSRVFYLVRARRD